MEYLAVGRWLVVIIGLALLGAPLSAWLFDGLPDRGGAFAVHVSLVVIGLVSFWIGHLTYGWIALVGGLGVVGLLSVLAYRRGVRPTWPHVGEGLVALVFGFVFTLGLRSIDNTIGPRGGEQFLHFGLLNAVDRADVLPPEDMWFAGESVAYYYGGHVLADQLGRLARTDPRLTYNLAFALTFGLTAAGAYGLVGAIVDAYGHDRRVGGVVGIFTVIFAGALVTPVRLLLGQLPTRVAVEYGGFAFDGIRRDWDMHEMLATQGSLWNWSWWHDRYVLHGTINEVPFFSLLKADLTGQVMSIPFVILLLGVAYSYYLTPAQSRRRRLLILAIVFPAMGGLVAWMNFWSFPVAIGIVGLALVFAPHHPLSILRPGDGPQCPTRPAAIARVEGSRLILSGAISIVIGILTVAWISPFVLFQLPGNDGIGIVTGRSPGHQWFLLWGALIILITTFLGIALYRRGHRDGWRSTTIGVTGAFVLAAVILVGLGDASVAISLSLLVLAWWLVRSRPTIGFIGVVIVGGLGLLVAMELVHAEVWPPDLERFNTVYKTTTHAYVILGVAAGAIITVVLSDAIGSLRDRISVGAPAAVGLVVGVVVLMALFPVLALGVEVGSHLNESHHGDRSIDALEGHEHWNSEEMEAVAWLEDRPGNPVLVEAPGESIYTWSNVMSTFTGLPTVAGWAHQRGYRGVDTYHDRVFDVDVIYEGYEPAAVDRLERYAVDYIVVSEIERNRYGSTINDFDAFEGISVAFENDEVRLYRVDSDRLAAPP